VQDPVPNYLAGMTRGLRGVRVGVDHTWNAGGVDPIMVNAVNAALEIVRGLGADIREVRFPDTSQILADWFPLCAVETAVAFRLPTEAEREYASLGGLAQADWPWHRGHPLATELSLLDRPHAPRPQCANGYGLLCMAENVHEWCLDWYGAGYYSSSPGEKPAGPAEGARRVSRGGSWRHAIKFTRLTARASLDPAYRYNDFGFRIYADA